MIDTAQHWVEVNLDPTEPALALDRDHTLHLLESQYDAQGAWEPLVDLLLDAVDESRDSAERLRLLRRIAAIYEHRVGDAAAAFTVMLAALREDAFDDEGWRELLRLAVETDAADELVAAADECASQLADAQPSRASDLLVRVAAACEDELGWPARATGLLERARDVDARHRGAIEALAAAYRRSGRWRELIELDEELAVSEPDPRRSAQLFVDMAEIAEQKLEQPQHALAAYRRALDRDPLCAPAIAGLEWLYRRLGMDKALVDLYCSLAVEHEHLRTGDDNAAELYVRALEVNPAEPRALEALAAIYERSGQWKRLIAMLSRLADVRDDPAARVDLHRKIAAILHNELDDATRAECELRIALEIDPSHGPAFEELAELRRSAGDARSAAELLENAAFAAPNEARRVRLLCDAARSFADEGDTGRATELFEAAFELDPDCVAAAEALVDVHAERRDWRALEPAIGLLVRKAAEGGASAHDRRDLHVRAGCCARELGKCRAAIKHYDAAVALGGVPPAVLLDRAAVLYEMRQWDRAAEAYREIRVQYADTLSADQRIRVGCCLGSIAHVRGERDKALAELRQVLDIDPHHSETLKVVIDIHRALGEWSSVVRAMRALLVRAASRERPPLLREMATILRDRLDRAPAAIEVYRDLLACDPTDHRALQGLVDLYVAIGHWGDAIEMIDRFASVEPNAFRRGKLYQTAGAICRQELGDASRAVDYLDTALECFFAAGAEVPPGERLGCLRAFAMIDEILTDARDFPAQANAYERMISRLAPTDPVLPRLLHSLGEIYRTRLHQPRRAIEAFERAAALEPPDGQRAAILSELYAQAGPTDLDKATAQYTRLIERDPHDVSSYQALRRIFTDTGQHDRAWWTCGALCVLGRASRDESRFYEEYRPRELPKATRPLGDDIWQTLYHPAQDRQLSAVLAVVSRAAALVGAHRHKHVGLDRRQARPLAGDQLHFSRILGYAGFVLGVELPSVYVQPDRPGEILVSNTAHRGQLLPALIARAEALQGCSAREIAFASARTLTLLRPEHYLRIALPTKAELRAALLSAIALVVPEFSTTPDDRLLVGRYRPHLEKRLTAGEREWLVPAVHRFLDSSGVVDLQRWSNAVRFTSHRAGLLVAGDLLVAAGRVRSEQRALGEPSTRDKLGQLLLFAVSEEHFAARHSLGWTLEQRA